ncbi:hypothetical protein LF860_02840 [Enterococcus hirae]|uniref:hypothetical protein n=1 Tax=Enterococcus hirae TaxID=1354 RepID=UPI001CF435EF|nr:hypothetical protein [Enterococcus hirae]
MITLSRLIFFYSYLNSYPYYLLLNQLEQGTPNFSVFYVTSNLFSYKILNYQYFEPDQLFVAELIGLILALLLPIAYLVYLNRKH